MIAIARRDVPGVDFRVGDFNALALRGRCLRRRHQLARPALRRRSRGGAARMATRLPLRWAPVLIRARSRGRTPGTMYGDVYRRHGVRDAPSTTPWPTSWLDGRATPDGPMRRLTRTQPLPSTWPMRTPSPPGAAPAPGVPRPPVGVRSEHAALTADMLTATPRQPDGSYAIPFGAFYLTARN